MPVLARFYGITIRMYFFQSEHNPPHIHVIYGDETAAFDIQSSELLFGHLPNRAEALVKEWILQNQQDLLEIWQTQNFKKLPPFE